MTPFPSLEGQLHPPETPAHIPKRNFSSPENLRHQRAGKFLSPETPVSSCEREFSSPETPCHSSERKRNPPESPGSSSEPGTISPLSRSMVKGGLSVTRSSWRSGAATRTAEVAGNVVLEHVHAGNLATGKLHGTVDLHRRAQGIAGDGGHGVVDGIV